MNLDTQISVICGNDGMGNEKALIGHPCGSMSMYIFASKAFGIEYAPGAITDHCYEKT